LISEKLGNVVVFQHQLIGKTLAKKTRLATFNYLIFLQRFKWGYGPNASIFPKPEESMLMARRFWLG
jgi:hypothetical protein